MIRKILGFLLGAAFLGGGIAFAVMGANAAAESGDDEALWVGLVALGGLGFIGVILIIAVFRGATEKGDGSGADLTDLVQGADVGDDGGD